VAPPSEKDLFLFGRTSRTKNGPAAEVAKQDFNGSYGYVLD
jgi:pilus assembly protein CpaC